MTTPDPERVRSLDAARAMRDALAQPVQPPVPDLARCSCGSVWFQPSAMTIDLRTARPIDYAYPITCTECGRETSQP